MMRYLRTSIRTNLTLRMLYISMVKFYVLRIVFWLVRLHKCLGY